MILEGEDLVLKAKTSAEAIHAEQPYGKTLTHFGRHLRDVHDVLIRFGFQEEYIFRAAAWVHDSVEDTREKEEPITFDKLIDYLGPEVTELVKAVTDDEGNRKYRREAMIKRLRAFPKAIKLKLADRIANFEFSLVTHSKIDMYASEYQEIRDALKPISDENFPENIPMWIHLDYLAEVSKFALTTARRIRKEVSPEMIFKVG